MRPANERRRYNVKSSITGWAHTQSHLCRAMHHHKETALYLTLLRMCFFVHPTVHYDDVIMSAMAPQITKPAIVYSSVYSGADQRKHHSSASLAFVMGIHQWPVNSPHEGTVMRKMFPFDDVTMTLFSSVVLCISLWIYCYTLPMIHK